MKDQLDVATITQGIEPTLETELERVGSKSGFFNQLGANHMAVFTETESTIFDEEETVLFVSFVEIDEHDHTLPDVCPLGARMNETNGWAHLCVMARGQTWYRAPEVYAFFDRLVDEAFFEDFDRVIFYGAGMGGYGAAAFSVTAPGASVLVFAPQATLNPEKAGWDDRFLDARRLNFVTRYGYAPAMTEAADRVFVIYDPMQPLDAMHAALFQGVFTTPLPVRFFGPDPAQTIASAGVMEDLVEAVADNTLDRTLFYKMMRARRQVRSYLRQVIYWTDERDRPVLTAMACRSILSRMKGPTFRRKLDEVLPVIEDRELRLPESLATQPEMA
ncbi:MAG: phosphoadenosine phosphosulfate reductase [Brevirhabdus sp.]